MGESAGTGGLRVQRLARRRALGEGGRCLLIFHCGLGILVGGGCAEQNGVLEVDSGPPIRFSRDAGRADTPVYAVHLGESLPMRFRAKMGVCDYAVLYDEAADKYSDCGEPATGRFEWPHSVGTGVPPGVPRRLLVSGYAQKGARDCMPICGELIEGGRPNDPKDWRIAQAFVVIEPYQSLLDTTVVMDGTRPDWGLSKLVLRRSDGQQTTIKAAGGQERGFAVTGPDERGGWRLRYEPACGEVNIGGETSAELVVADDEGRTRVFSVSFSTP